jgi:Tol biopolymer transport system component
MLSHHLRSCRWVPLLCTVLLLFLMACSPSGQTLTPTPATRATAAPSSTPTGAAHPATCPATTQGPPVDIKHLTGRITFALGIPPEVYVMNADGTGLLQLTHGPAANFDPSWSPDGKRIVFRSERDGAEIYVMNADGSGQKNLTNNPTADFGPAWSRPGTRIAFNSSREGGLPNISVMNPDGSGVKRLTTIEGEYPAWSPDGKKIAFMSAQPGATGSNATYDIYVMNADGSGLKQLTTAPGEDGWPAWSPDGKKIAFASGRDDHGQSGDIGPFFDIYVMNADGSQQTQLTQPFGQFVAWSPDGTKLVVAGFCLYVLNADGSGATPLLSGEVILPDWIA